MIEGESTWGFLCCRLVSEGLWPKSWLRKFLLNESTIKTVMKQIWGRGHWSLQLPPPTHSHTFPHLPDTFCSSWKMQYILLRQLLLKLLMTNLWLNSKVALPIWTLLVYELVLPLGTVLPSFICRHRQIFPLTLQSGVFSFNFSHRMSWVHSLLHSWWGEDYPTALGLLFSKHLQFYIFFSSCMKYFGGRFSTGEGGQVEKNFSCRRLKKSLFLPMEANDSPARTARVYDWPQHQVWVSQAIMKSFKGRNSRLHLQMQLMEFSLKELMPLLFYLLQFFM